MKKSKLHDTNPPQSEDEKEMEYTPLIRDSTRYRNKIGWKFGKKKVAKMLVNLRFSRT